MARHGVPTARFRTTRSLDEAQQVVRSGEFGMPVVLKADGLAAGKGVVVAQSLDEAEVALTAAMRDARFGEAGKTIVVEECLTGPEVSFFLVCDGARACRSAPPRITNVSSTTMATEYRRYGRVPPSPVLVRLSRRA
jgi:phosphoribosylamine--glycine ligase